MTRTDRSVYICLVCHLVDQKPLGCHPSNSVVCDAGEPGDERSKPLFDRQGRLATRAPKWWVDACFQGKGGRGYTSNREHS